MAQNITINVTSATEGITISGYPEGIVFSSARTTTPFVVATPSNLLTVVGSSGATVVDIDTYTNNSVEAINIGPQLNVTLGTLAQSAIQNELDGFKYSFPNFIDSETSTLIYGDIVYLESDLSVTANEWKSRCKKALTSDVYKGAFNCLFVFVSHIGNNLIVLNKGFFDLEDANITQWTAGRTLYLNETNKIDITPSNGPSNWVKSIGFCVPNKDNKKRIWFEPDSTYIKIN